ncbi:MAG: glycoside hydrolase family 25 protein [Bacteroidales bacterium]|nr:glycoside hydrolase family 25 protein [Bacteroidales bacterium]MCM1414370.1 glycoside hydrolase family 25 protein [bacterium]MCM1424936.1 glycoside hydrolase family 25 protein [bacterium]
MKLPGEEEVEGGMGPAMIYMVIGVSVFVLIVLFAVLKGNDHKRGGSEAAREAQGQQEEAAAEELAAPEEEDVVVSKRRAEDLDFWDMYPEETEEEKEKAEETAKNPFTEKAEQEKEAERQKEEEARNDPATDGKHTLITNRNGEEEWLLISPYLEKNTLDFTKMEDNAGLKRYMENGRKISYVGADISKHTGKIHFPSLKAAGLDYVMIRLGSRGYSSGQIALDENFKENIDGALEAGLDVGIYFYSQAITQDEAVQEANFVVQNLEPYRGKVKYPVAFNMGFVSNDQSRIEGLGREDKTTVTLSFLEAVRAAGYVPMVYGDKEWLLKEVDLAKLTDYDIWLSQEEEIPDYPYRYAMWQYNTDGVLNGIDGGADLNICFIGYSER